MKDKWHRKLPFVKVIEKGVLHLEQTISVEKERNEREEKKERKKERKKENGVQFSTGILAFEQREFDDEEASWTTLQEVGVLFYSG